MIDALADHLTIACACHCITRNTKCFFSHLARLLLPRYRRDKRNWRDSLELRTTVETDARLAGRFTRFAGFACTVDRPHLGFSCEC